MPEWMDEVRALVGSRRVYTAPEPLGAAACRYFAMAVGDDNPLYTDRDFARGHGLPDVTAPPTLLCETNQYAGLPSDSEGYAGHTWGVHVPGTRQVRGGNTYTFHRRVRPDDVVTATWEVTDVTEKVNQRGELLVIITSRATYTNQEAQLLAENEETMVLISPPQSPGESPGESR